MTFPSTIWLVLLTALIVSAIGFYKYVYFISLGYGYSIAVIGVVLIRVFAEELSVGTTLACVLFILYGVRLGTYLLVREIKSASYRGAMKKEIKDGSTMGFGAKCAIWITCALLYMLQVTPIYYRLANGAGSDGVCIVGVIIMAFGIIFESAADIQKSKAKKENPKRFCDTGLFRIVRCPNYLGEMIFWTGVLISGLNILRDGQWVLALLGHIGIIWVMFSGARRLEIRQNRNYGADEAYQKYVKSVPILLPLVPLYSVEKYKFLVG